MTNHLEALRNLIALGANEIGGEARVEAERLLAVLDAGQDAPDDESAALAVRPGKARKSAELWDAAHEGGFASIFADMMTAQNGAGDPIPPEAAFFCGWYAVYKRTGGRRILEAAGLESTVTGIANWLNRSRTCVYKWMAADWFELNSFDAWVQAGLAGIIPDALNQLHKNVLSHDGRISNTAIKTTLSAYKEHRQAQQNIIIINQNKAGSGDPVMDFLETLREDDEQ